jgi:hypothetical protein
VGACSTLAGEIMLKRLVNVDGIMLLKYIPKKGERERERERD